MTELDPFDVWRAQLVATYAALERLELWASAGLSEELWEEAADLYGEVAALVAQGLAAMAALEGTSRSAIAENFAEKLASEDSIGRREDMAAAFRSQFPDDDELAASQS